ncbi:MAG: putative dehydrogenase [Planctomycetota bacterium]|jgi:predicted dehydrogenase
MMNGKPEEPSSTKKQTRRKFLATTAALAASFTILPRHVLGGPGFIAPSERINVAVIGTGGQGLSNIRSLLSLPEVQIPAICDVNWESDYSRFYYGGKAGRGPALKLIKERMAKRNETAKPTADYVDFREMLEKEKDIDAVLVATPDHAHAIATMHALKNKKHVYCEKPLTHTVSESRAIAQAAKEAKVATQMGNQGHSGDGIRQTVEWIQAGAIGAVREVHAWTDGGAGWTQHMTLPSEASAVPKKFDWERWQGPVAHRPYHVDYAPYNWRGWWDYGTGAIGDMACHNMDPAFWALKLGHPSTVEACSAPISDVSTSKYNIIRYQFPARGEMPPVALSWYDSGLMPPRPAGLDPDVKMGGNGIIFVGDKGVMMCGGWGGAPQLLPAEKMKSFKRPAQTIARVEGHHQDWLNAIKAGGRACCDFEYAAHLTEVILLGNVASRVGKMIVWDGDKMKATNAPEADIYINHDYQNGWSL